MLLGLVKFNLIRCLSTECGIADNSDEARLSYLVIVFGTKEHMLYKTCIGTVIKRTFNDSFSDLVLTSKTCLEKENIRYSGVSSSLSLNWHSAFHGILKILEPIATSHKSAKIPNFALLKLRTPLSLSDGNVPICLPEGRFPYTADVQCYMPHITKTSQLCGTSTIAAFNDDMVDFEKYKIITEGAPLLCRINNTDYQYGIYDWTKLHKVSKTSSRPITIFTNVWPFTASINYFANTNATGKKTTAYFLCKKSNCFLQKTSTLYRSEKKI
ncbi:Serine protease [Trichinella pseudospiralis]